MFQILFLFMIFCFLPLPDTKWVTKNPDPDWMRNRRKALKNKAFIYQCTLTVTSIRNYYIDFPLYIYSRHTPKENING